MRCPRCEGALDERDREGVVVDVCRSCRGIWLDRGELEKIIARSADEREEDWREAERTYRRHGSDRPPPHGYGKHRRKKSWLENLGDIFD